MLLYIPTNTGARVSSKSLIPINGFTLIELLVVMGIVGFLSGVLLINFRSPQTGDNARYQTASVVVSDIRSLQSQSLSGKSFISGPACGFGIHYTGTKSYIIYARQTPEDISCEADIESRNYSGGDIVVYQKELINPRMTFTGIFPDIFFELPQAKVFIDNDSSINTSTNIGIVVEGESSPTTQITISTSGSINLTQ